VKLLRSRSVEREAEIERAISKMEEAIALLRRVSSEDPEEDRGEETGGE